MESIDYNSTKLVKLVNKLIEDYFRDVTENSIDNKELKGIAINVNNILSEVEHLGKEIVVPYSQISQLIFLDFQSSQDGFSELFDEIERHLDSKDNTNQVLTMHKILENLRLAFTQKQCLFSAQQNDIDLLKEDYNRFSKRIETQTNEANRNINNKVITMSAKLTDLSNDTQKEINSRINSLYSSFVSVLGIFISISFTLFGAATLLNNIFSIATRNGFNTSHDLIGSNIMLAGFATMLIYLLLIGIMQSISSVTKTHYDFSLRRIFIIFFMSSGIILVGFIYKNPDISKIKPNLLIYMIMICMYITVGFVLYRYGFKIKNKVLGRKNNFEIVALAEKASPLSDLGEPVGEVTKIRFRVRNKSQGQSYIDKVLMGKNQEDAIRLNVESFRLLSQEHKYCEVYQNADNNEPLNKNYLSDIKNDKYYLFLYTYSSVIKQKIKINNK